MKPTLINDHFQNYKKYNIPKAQLIISDIPYNLGVNAYASSTEWYIGGDNKNGESEKAGKQFFDTDKDFKIDEFLFYANKILKKEPKEVQQSPALLIFCSFEQQFEIIEKAPKYGFKNYINLVFKKNFSPQVLKANMKIVGNSEYAILLYREKLPKFNNNGKMIMNCMDWINDTKTPKIHPTQKPIPLLEKFIEIFTDKGEVVIDMCAGSGTTLLAAAQCDRKAYGFEIKKEFCRQAEEKLFTQIQKKLF